MRTHRQGSSELCFPHKGKKPGEREGKKNPYTTVLHYWVGQNPTNREELEEEGGLNTDKSSMFRARCPARHTWELSPLYWPSLRVRTQYRVFLGFTHSLELLLLLNNPRKLRHHGKGREEARTRREGFFASLHCNSGRKNRKILSFFGFLSRRTSSLHLLFEEQEEGEKGLGRRGCGCCRGQSKISIV